MEQITKFLEEWSSDLIEHPNRHAMSIGVAGIIILVLSALGV